MQYRSKIKKRKIMIPLTILLTIVLVAGVIYLNPKALQARASLPGVETIVMNNSNTDPYVILEIVPSKQDARVGYLVGGEEPADDKARSIKDMPLLTERESKFSPIQPVPDDLTNALSLSETKYVEPGESTIEIRGAFEEVGENNGDYSKASSDDLYEKCVDETAVQNAIAAGKTLYRHYVSYRIGSGEGTWNLQFKQLDENVIMPTQPEGRGESYDDCYNYQYFIAEDVGENFINAKSGDIICKKSGDNLGFFGMMQDDGLYKNGESSTYVLNADESYEDFKIVHEAQGSDENVDELYYITSVDNSNGPYGVTDSLQMEEKDELDGYSNITDYTIPFYILKENTSEFSYNPGSGSYSFHADYTQDVLETVSYSGGYVNQEWLKKNVFDLDDDALNSMIIDVVPVTLGELTTDMIGEADLLYFAGGEWETNADSDVTEECAKALVSQIESGMPVVMNRSLYTNAGNNVYLQKMGACILQNEITTGMWDKDITILQNGVRIPADSGEMCYVNNNIFVYDDTTSGSGNKMISNTFNDSFSTQEIEYGFESILDEIDSENFYLEVAGKEERIERKASVATAIRYIINSGDKRMVTKAALNILDLEPWDFEDYYNGNNPEDVKTDIGISHTTVKSIMTDSISINMGVLSKDWIIDNLAQQFSDKSDKISVDIMGTKEFIGKQMDLNETYDMIYIGADTSIMNTTLTGDSNNKLKTDETVYNDGDMNGLVYAHMGDAIATNSELSSDTYQLSGNDITKDRLRELQEYVEAGYAVLISDNLLIGKESSISVNTNKVDSSSNMYQFINDTVLAKDTSGNYKYYGKNVTRKSSLEGTDSKVTSTREIFNKYLNISKLILEYDKNNLPPEYNQEDGSERYLTMNANGEYVLDYEFTLKNDSAVEVSQTSYDCGLYFDMDADGRYESAEKMNGLTIVRTDDSSEQTMDDQGIYHLSAGYTYHISRNVPEGFSGFLSWKIIFSQNGKVFSAGSDRAIVRRAVSGFCAVKALTVKPQIRVLQICPGNDTTGKNLDLDSDAMQSLYSQASDFDVTITKISASDYIKKTGFTSDNYIDYLKSFDMIVLGFDDSYNFSGGTVQQCKDAILGIREYTVSGRSIMFTHDLNSFILDENSDKSWWGYYANIYLRDVQGMDRYGNVASSGKIPQEEKYQYLSQFDTSSLRGKMKEAIGFSDATIIGHKDSITYGVNARAATYYFRIHYSYYKYKTAQNYFENSEISKINSGQITEYPFKISDKFNVSHTHPQYFQLNLDTDYTDDNLNDDVVVWYTISGMDSGDDSFFAANKNDVRNNYYIYNKGNVTYTGSGDHAITDEMERKLFVNTLVAAYNSGIHAPITVYKESQWKTSAGISNKYVPYDPAMNNETGSFLEKKLTVNFYTANNNLQYNNTNLYAQYYVEGTSSKYDLYTDGKFLKLIQPLEFYKITENGTELVKTASDSGTLQNYSMYSMAVSVEQIGLANMSGSIKDTNSANIYVRLGCEELKGGNVIESLPAAESLNKLGIVCIQMFELQ